MLSRSLTCVLLILAMLSPGDLVAAGGTLCVFTRPAAGPPLQPGSRAARKDVADVMAALGYQAEIPIFAGPVQNAAAYPSQAGRGPMIVYNPRFLTRLYEINDHAPISVIAHEIGHFVAKNANHPHPHVREIAADEVSGCAMALMGVSLADATAAMIQGLPRTPGTTTHPSTESRVRAIAES